MVVNALFHESVPDAALKAASAHDAPLQKGTGEAAFPKGRESASGVVAEHDYRVGDVDLRLQGSRLEVKRASEGLPPDMVVHVIVVGRGPDDDLAVLVRPPPEDHPPAVEGGVPGDDRCASRAGLASQESRI